MHILCIWFLRGPDFAWAELDGRKVVESCGATCEGLCFEAEVLEVDYRRYVGAQIGIYNPKGAKVGAVSHLRNKELIFVAGRGAAAAAEKARAYTPA